MNLRSLLKSPRKLGERFREAFRHPLFFPFAGASLCFLCVQLAGTFSLFPAGPTTVPTSISHVMAALVGALGGFALSELSTRRR